MPESLRGLLTPPNNPHAKIWRYMSFSKYVSMLQQKALFFSRSDRFLDPWEGSTSDVSIRSRAEFFASSDLLCKPQEDIDSFFQRVKSRTYINCWHMSEHESEAMWRLYGKTEDIVSIQSTYSKLSHCLGGEKGIMLGAVKYIDYKSTPTDPENTVSNFFYKRHSFEHEKELRAIMQDLTGIEDASFDIESQKDGVTVPIDLDQLIDIVYISPLAPSWFLDVVKETTEKLEHLFSVEQSSLNNPPIY